MSGATSEPAPTLASTLEERRPAHTHHPTTWPLVLRREQRVHPCVHPLMDVATGCYPCRLGLFGVASPARRTTPPHHPDHMGFRTILAFGHGGLTQRLHHHQNQNARGRNRTRCQPTPWPPTYTRRRTQRRRAPAPHNRTTRRRHRRTDGNRPSLGPTITLTTRPTGRRLRLHTCRVAQHCLRGKKVDF
jgi:hypothetical protein